MLSICSSARSGTNRHCGLRHGVESGKIKIITNKEFNKLEGYHPEVIVATIWKVHGRQPIALKRK